MPGSKPNTPDAQATVDEAGAGGTDANLASDTAKAAVDLAKLSEAFGGRQFADPDEVVKAVKHLNSLVGDRTISDLRKKAESHEAYESLVAGLAEKEGIPPEDARKRLSEMSAPSSSRARDTQVDSVMKEVSELKLQLSERDFIAEHPEAKTVLKEVRALAAATGQSLAEAYESSSLKNMLQKAAATDEREKTGTSFRPSQKSGVPNDKFKAAMDRLKSDASDSAKDDAVKAALGL